MKKDNNIYVIGIFILFLGISCSDYLDVVPDNIPTIDHAFNRRYEAEGFLFGLYGFLPDYANPRSNPAFFGSDETWLFKSIWNFSEYRLWEIALGAQGTESPIADYWASEQNSYSLDGGKPLFTGIRDCNIFLENIDNVIDLPELEKNQWKGEALTLQAYFYFWLCRMYGPIPLMKENIPIGERGSKVNVYREPVDSVFSHIVNLLDEASQLLQLSLLDPMKDMGRITKPFALALKAQVLTYAASPFFNGNPDYYDFVDKRGINLFPTTYDPNKWEKAAIALKEAIDISHEAGHALFDFSSLNLILDPKTIMAQQVRGAVTERWNNEIIWSISNSNTSVLQRNCAPSWSGYSRTGVNLRTSSAPPLKIIEQFYTKNGLPIEEDKDWIGIDLYKVRDWDQDHKLLIADNFKTINLHFNREPRFYGSVMFDGGTFFGEGMTSDSNLPFTGFHTKTGYLFMMPFSGPITGYLVKKQIHRLTTVPVTSQAVEQYRYSFPVLRLADLYLMYAEALNELKDIPDEEVFEYIDLVRNRSGLKGVVESWNEHAIDPNKCLTKDGMRQIIRRERLNELAFEGIRFWDIRRWKMAEELMNTSIQGLNVYAEEYENFYEVKDIDNITFNKKDYLWPIRTSVLLNNPNLVQNPGW